MCNPYSHRKGLDRDHHLSRSMTSEVGSLAPADSYPDYAAFASPIDTTSQVTEEER